MNVISVGVDIVSLERIQRVYEKHGEAFLERVYTANERQAITKLKSPISFMAGRWAAKEAIYKSLQIDLKAGVTWQDMDILKSANGAPTVVLSGQAKKQAELKGIEQFLLSISHDRQYAVAFVTTVEK